MTITFLMSVTDLMVFTDASNYFLPPPIPHSPNPNKHLDSLGSLLGGADFFIVVARLGCCSSLSVLDHRTQEGQEKP